MDRKKATIVPHDEYRVIRDDIKTFTCSWYMIFVLHTAWCIKVKHQKNNITVCGLILPSWHHSRGT